MDVEERQEWLFCFVREDPSAGIMLEIPCGWARASILEFWYLQITISTGLYYSTLIIAAQIPKLYLKSRLWLLY